MNKEVNELLNKLGELEDAPLIWVNKKVYDASKEIERLNNNIDVLENDLWNIAQLLDIEEGSCVEDILDKIKELKEKE